VKILPVSYRALTAGLVLGTALAAGASGAAPAAAAGTPTTITITAGGDRTTDTAVSGLGGVTFQVQGDATPEQCTTDATGTCTVTVDGGKAYTITEASPDPAGWYSNPQLGVGSLTSVKPADYTTVTTPKVTAGQQVSIPVPATNSTSATTGRSGVWALSRNDPSMPAVCGLRVALLFDLSSSITSPTNHLPDYKTAATGFVNALRGTPASVGLYTFGTAAPAANTSGTNNTNLPLTSVASGTGADAVNAKINGLGVPSGSYTNWDSGLWQIANSPTKYDAVIVLTDGDPTKYGTGGTGGTSGGTTRFAETENGIFSANALKAKGTRVMAVGMGVTDPGSIDNLRSISGPTSGSDYYTSDFSALGDVLKGIVAKNCNGTINVVKNVIPGSNPGDTSAATPAPGWTFNETQPTATGVTGDSGGTSFSTGLSTDPTTITEAQQPGYTMAPQGSPAKNATCVNNTTGQPVPVTDAPDGFTVTPDPQGIISCTVYNQEQPAPAAPDPASVVVDKTWVINGKTYPGGSQDPNFQALPELNPIYPADTAPAWGQVYNGYKAGDTVTVGDLPEVPVGCREAESGDLGDQTLTAGLNTFHVTNTLTCTSRLTLSKQVDNPYPGVTDPASPDSWTLEARAGDQSPPAESGTSGVSAVVDPDTRYTLSESGVPGYAPHVDPDTTVADGATGSWQCEQLLTPRLRAVGGTRGLETFAGGDGTVSLPPGTVAQCTLHNSPEPAHLTLVKHVVNDDDGNAVPDDWTLLASPRTRESLPTGGGIEGKSGSAQVTDVAISPGTPYLLAESGGKSGYKRTGLECQGADLRDGQITAGINAHVTCVFTNTEEKKAHPPKPPKPPKRPKPPKPGKPCHSEGHCRPGKPGKPGKPVVPVTG